MAKTWHWIDYPVVSAIHDQVLARYGGLDGVRNKGAVESALTRPRNLCSYGRPDAAELVAAYAFGLACNHGFLDGNKRTAWVVARLFLEDNGQHFLCEGAEAVVMMENLAAGKVNEADLAAWFRKRINHK